MDLPWHLEECVLLRSLVIFELRVACQMEPSEVDVRVLALVIRADRQLQLIRFPELSIIATGDHLNGFVHFKRDDRRIIDVLAAVLLGGQKAGPVRNRGHFASIILRGRLASSIRCSWADLRGEDLVDVVPGIAALLLLVDELLDLLSQGADVLVVRPLFVILF